ncbi:hypothetical protein K1T71_010300 [Dendrolimus kikuchii]|uniref:Uncharacterized protein n=1 Tax=Dendrolimus kikuchii TaxID=765133 RepID=A0ACC1CR70_9NEOP|nr:hypothetical protein K1T71_010300 [Dendrolimus kikuchii]
MAGTLLLLLATAAAGARLGDLARRDTGDIFTIIGGECSAAQCAEHGAGARTNDANEAPGACACACPQRAPLFREDRELCVDDLPECSLATFGTGTAIQRIPFVYLPLKGQIIHPSREITFQNVKTPICAVSGAQFLTRKGFLDLRNTLDADVPFNLFRDEGRTFLQWSGEDDVRTRMSGRVMVVRLLCRDVSAAPTSPLDLRGVFTPCVAFRVQGTPPKPLNNVTEVQFAPNAQTSDTGSTTGLSVAEYVAIGFSSLLLGLIYVASVFLFLHIRKRRQTASEGSEIRKVRGPKNKDGASITERDIVRVNNELMQTIIIRDDGIIKKNPLLGISRQYHEIKNFPSDSGSNISDSEDFADSSARSDDNLYNNQITSALIHQHRELKLKHENSDICHRDESGIERLPDEHVSIVETTDDREIARPVGTTRRKLYFNPAYFEPQLMAEPPPAALEFLVKIREVIAIAKHKMAAKRFQPVLNQIPEEETYASNGNSIDLYSARGSQRSSLASLKRENSRKKNCIGCPGCKSDDMPQFIKHNIPTCSNCLSNKGDKQSSIRKWLENIPLGKQQPYNEFLLNTNQKSIVTQPATEGRRSKLRPQHSFTASSSMYHSDNFSVPKRLSTMSVRSEPSRRNYNFTPSEFDDGDYVENNYNFYQSLAPVEFNDYRSRSMRNIVREREKSIKHNNVLPDMVNEAIALDNCSKVYNQNSSDDERFSDNNHGNIIPSTYIRRTSESPHGNDYETDSLERNSNKKGLFTPSEYPEVPSSQASPSLSNALPLEEELTMRNAVYKTASSSNSNTPSPHRDIQKEQNLYEAIGVSKVNSQPNSIKTQTHTEQSSDYSLVSEVYVNNNYNFGSAPTSPSGSECSIGSRKLNKKIDEKPEKPGCLTIEVKDNPENYIKIHESDGFEPDTLDRKHLKHKEIDKIVPFSRANFIGSVEKETTRGSQRIELRSSGTFKKISDKVEYSPKFHSLRNDYDQNKSIHENSKCVAGVYSESKSLEEPIDDTWDDFEEWNTEDARVLTLELRHSKRQRQSTPPTIKQIKSLARPDILPPLPHSDDDPIYEQPTFPPRRVELDNAPMHQKNVSGRSLSPRTLTSTTAETCDNSLTSESHYGPSCSPMRASVNSQSSEYENVDPVRVLRITGDLCRNYSGKFQGRSVSGPGINTDTFTKVNKPRFRRKKGPIVQDSGYLSSDSTSSKPLPRRTVLPKIVNSESDDTDNEARSESGAESVETHSVFFNNFRLLQNTENNNNTLKKRTDNKL